MHNALKWYHVISFCFGCCLIETILKTTNDILCSFVLIQGWCGWLVSMTQDLVPFFRGSMLQPPKAHWQVPCWIHQTWLVRQRLPARCSLGATWGNRFWRPPWVEGWSMSVCKFHIQISCLESLGIPNSRCVFQCVQVSSFLDVSSSPFWRSARLCRWMAIVLGPGLELRFIYRCWRMFNRTPNIWAKQHVGWVWMRYEWDNSIQFWKILMKFRFEI